MVFQRSEAPVGNGDAVGIASEILQHVLRTAEGLLSVDHPFLVMEGCQVAGESGWIAERSEVAAEAEFSGSVGFL